MQRRFLRPFLVCLIPLVLAGLLVADAYVKNQQGRGGFKLGVDLVGGTILVYEVDRAKMRTGPNDEPFRIADLAAALKRRIDPNDLKNVVIRPAGEDRIELILPTGGQTSGGKSDLSLEEVEKTKELIRQVGSLEFQIVANQNTDGQAFEGVLGFFKDPNNKAAIDQAQLDGVPPPIPAEPFSADGLVASYQWVEIGQVGRREKKLLNPKPGTDDKPATPSLLWTQIDEAARRGEPFVQQSGRDEEGNQTSEMYFRRDYKSRFAKPEDVEKKKYEYFLLTRSSDSVKVGGNVSITASAGTDGRSGKPSVDFRFNGEGARQFGDVTSRNIPKAGEKQALAIIIDGFLVSNPGLNSRIAESGQITGGFTFEYVKEMVQILRSGALPATLKGEPVSENAVSPNLGLDTVRKGTWSILIAFLAVLGFMLVYYRFAGFVATVALFANLLLTIGGMVLLNATFTLPGLAGLVLMLGMAVDANVLIYERVREERERGAGLAMAIRNGYDRAFGTIIDTHLSSIFTAVVLYAVGNDQLKGFGVSLTLGLVISLFTSLYMTRLMFDFWLAKGWLKNLRMMRLFARPNFDFMSIRKLMFAITLVVSILGLGLFLYRGKDALNVDFNGGTAYDGQLTEPKSVEELRAILGDQDKLKVDRVERRVDDTGKFQNQFEIFYADGTRQTVSLANAPTGDTEEQQLADLKARASTLPDVSTEQRFRGNAIGGERSTDFTVRTTERERDLVQAAVERLFAKEGGDSLLAKTTLAYAAKGPAYELTFTNKDGNPSPTAPSYIGAILERNFRTAVPNLGPLPPFSLTGVGDNDGGRYSKMNLELTSAATDVLKAQPAGDSAKVVADIVKSSAANFESRPQPERLETFDATLAAETRSRALIAIVASWAAILLYLWFRFGSWQFGAAAVLCLIHDLCFTLGMIALCHYIAPTTFGSVLLLQDFKIDLPAIAALLTLVGYSVNDTIVVFDRIREVRGKNPLLTPKIINDSVNQTLSRTVLAALTVFLVVIVLYIFGGDGVHLFAFVMVMGVIVGTYSSIYIAAPLLLIFGEGRPEEVRGRTTAVTAGK